MKKLPYIKTLIISSIMIMLLSSCKKDFSANNYVAYFGGEVTNSTNPYILFCKNNEVIDTIPIKKDNTFFIKFDSLTPGLYSFKNEPEYQYVYFDKNDSIMVRLNSKDFDNSIIFCGRGDEKNNYLMEMYLRNEKDKNKMFNVFEYDVPKFITSIDSSYNSNKKLYAKRKSEINWNDDFDVYAKAAVDFHHYAKKEVYPFVHKMRTGNDIATKLPVDFYNYRKDIDFNSSQLAEYSPFVMYLSQMLNNVGSIKYHNHYTDVDLALKTNINKLNIADTLIKNAKVKNTVLNTIAFNYLLEDQNMVNNQKFLEIYHKYSTDKGKNNEITEIGNAIQLLKTGNPLPEVMLVGTDGKTISSKSIINSKTVIFFWSSKSNSHLIASHKKIDVLQNKYPDYKFIGINLDDDQTKWVNAIKNNNLKSNEYRCEDFEDIKTKWAITKIYRTIVLTNDGIISNAFTNIFNANFENNLK